MQLHARWLVFIVCCQIGLSCQKTGVPSVKQPSPMWSDVQRDAKGATDEADPMIETLLFESRFIFETANQYRTQWTHRYRILTDDALEHWSLITAHWAPWRQERPEIRASVTSPSGDVVPLDPKTIVDKSRDESSAKIISNARQLVAPLPQLQVGSVVETVVSINHLPSAYGPGMSASHYFGSIGRRVESSALVIQHSKNVEIKAKQYGIELTPEEQIENGVRTARWAVHDLEPIRRPERNLPVEMAIAPSIKITTGTSWASLAQAYFEHVDHHFERAECAAELKSLLAENRGTTEERIAALLQNLRQRVRYTGLELGENSIVPVGPCETLARGFGDCKDQATLLIAALKHLNIEAHLALVKADYDVDVDPQMPSLMEFNHAVVYIPGKEPLWIDPTLEYSRPGEISSAVLDRNILVISDRTTELLRTPANRAELNVYQEVREVKLSSMGGGSVREVSSYRGAYERYERARAVKSGDQEKLRENLASYVKNVYRTEKMVQAHQEDPQDLSKPFGYQVVANEIGVAQTDENEAVVALMPWNLFQYIPDEIDPREFTKKDLDEERSAPLELPTPGRAEIEYRVIAPVGYRNKPLPKPSQHRIGPFSFGVSYQASDERTVVANYYLEHSAKGLAAKQYGELRRTLLKWADDFPHVVEFENIAMRLLNNGKYKDALVLLQDTVKAATGSAEDRHVYQLWYSKALLTTGFGDAAIQAAKRATEISPQSPEAWIGLGWAQEHNYLAQRFGKGYDRPAAIAAYQQAIKLDKENMVSRMSLAILLEHNKHGQRYLDLDDLNAAIDEYQRIFEFDDNVQVKKNMLVAAVMAGRFGDVLEKTDEAPDDSFLANLRLTAILAKEGKEAGLASSLQLFSDEEERLDALAQAVEYLIHNRRYPLAADILQASARGASGVDKQVRASRLREVKQLSQELRLAKGPEQIMQRVYRAAFNEDHQLDDLWLPEMRSILPDDFEEDFLVGLRQGMKLNQSELPRVVLRDFVLSLMKYKKKGDDRIGYRIVGSSDGGGKSSHTSYVVKQNGRYWLAGLQGTGYQGVVIAKFLARGEVKRAQKWLDWVAQGNGRGSTFNQYWTQGCQGDRHRAQLANWFLLSSHKETIQPVINEVETAVEQNRYPGKKTALNRIRLRSYMVLERYADAMKLAEEMIDAREEVRLAWNFFLGAAGKSRNYRRLKKVAERELKLDPDNSIASIALNAVLLESENPASYWKAIKKKERSESLSPMENNNMAWLTLFSHGSLKQGLDYSLKSLQVMANRPSYLHTLATIHAELGNSAESHQLMQKIYLTYDEPEPKNADWYVIGRLAEHYRLVDVARESYCRVEKPEHKNPMATYHLAKKRLRKMRVKCGKK